MNHVAANGRVGIGETNKLYLEDRVVHDWYRFVLSFPAHLVRDYLERFHIDHTHRVLDPFCGTGTVLVECKKLGIPSEGIEANPIAHFATKVKTDWRANPEHLLIHARDIAEEALDRLRASGIEDEALLSTTQNTYAPLLTLSAEETDLLLTNSISPLPLHKALVLINTIKEHFHEQYSHYELLALAKSIVNTSSNLRFGPEVGIGSLKKDAPVITAWLHVVQTMVTDLRIVRECVNTSSTVHCRDSREAFHVLEPASIDAVITSPPYPNEKDYTRTTRLESVLLGFIHNKTDLQALKKALLCSNTRTVYKGDTDNYWVRDYPEVKRLAFEIEGRRIELQKTSGFEKLYAKVTELYFGGMARHLAFLRPALRPGAQLAYVVGDQASYFRILIPTGRILAAIGRSLGYELVGTELFRTRFSTATKEQLREEVVLFRWPGKSTHFSLSDTRPIMLTHSMKNVGGDIMDTLFPEDEFRAGEIPLSEEDTSNEEGGRFTLSSPSPKKLNRYQRLLEHIFKLKYEEGASEVMFERQDLEAAARDLAIKLPKNLGDVIYSFRYRTALPDYIKSKAPQDKEWTISPSGRSRYCFVAKDVSHITPQPMMATIKIPDATPGIVAKYAQGDEQSLLAKLRYNRLIDIFTRVTCYSLQNHLRTAIKGMGQVETDEIYVGIDRSGVQYVFPVQAKGGSDKIGITQIEQDIALCSVKFPQLVCRPIAAQFIEKDRIALFEFIEDEEGVRLHREIHYRLVSPEKMTDEDLKSYRASAADTVRD